MSDPGPQTLPDGSQPSDRAFIERSIRVAIVGLMIVASSLGLLWILKSALTPLALAFAIAYLCDPVIDRFEEQRIGRRVAIFLLLGLFGILIFGFAFAVVPRIQGEIATLAEAMPGYLDSALRDIAPAFERIVGIQFPDSIQQALTSLRQGGFEVPVETLRELVGRLVGGLGGTVATLAGLFVVPVIGYYLLAEFDEIRRRLTDLIPPARREGVLRTARTIDELLSGFIRGQLMVCLILGVLYAGGFAVIGIQSAVVIGFVAGLLAIIPYVGGAVALVTASVMALLQFGVDLHVGLVVGWYALVQTLDGVFLTPRIVGKSIGLHPVTVIVALLIGGDLLGFLGLLVAVPVAAMAQVFIREGLVAYRNSSLYTG